MSVTQVRTLIGTPLRGELTVPASNLPRTQSGSGIDESLQSIQGLLSQVVRLSASHSSTPTLVVSSESDDADIPDDSAAPWSWTAAEAASTESALLPFLMHLAAARDDIAGMKFCLRENRNAEVGTEGGNGVIVGGVADCIDAASGRSPLHVAALNGSIHCVNILLEAGALVHLRDSLGHTPLYYVSIFSTRSMLMKSIGADLVSLGCASRARRSSRPAGKGWRQPWWLGHRGRICIPYISQSRISA